MEIAEMRLVVEDGKVVAGGMWVREADYRDCVEPDQTAESMPA